MLMRILMYAMTAYILTAAAIMCTQRYMLYRPDAQTPPASLVHLNGLQFWPAPENYRGFLGTDVQAPVRGTVVVFHGNTGLAVNRNYFTNALGKLGYRVLLAEYPYYGGRAGKANEESFMADARDTVERAYREFGAPLYLWGESLGAGVAATVAADPPVPIAGLILLTPWDSFAELAQTVFWFIPARWLVWDRFDSVANLKGYSGRVAIILARQDEVIPMKHGERLYQSITAPKQLWVFDNVGHNSWPVTPDEYWWRNVMEFVAGK
jgi:pimeloyl-ACP methyl ester carboxylesterase